MLQATGAFNFHLVTLSIVICPLFLFIHPQDNKATTKAKAPLKGVKKTTKTKAKKAPAKKKAVKLIKSKKAPKAKGTTISKKTSAPKKKVAKGGKKKK